MNLESLFKETLVMFLWGKMHGVWRMNTTLKGLPKTFDRLSDYLQMLPSYTHVHLSISINKVWKEDYLKSPSCLEISMQPRRTPSKLAPNQFLHKGKANTITAYNLENQYMNIQ